MPSNNRANKKFTAKIVTILVVVCAIFVILGMRIGAIGIISPVKFIFLDATGGIQKVVSSPIRWGKGFWDSYVELQKLKAKNRALKQEVDRLSQELVRYREALIAKDRLERLLDLKRHLPYPTLAANVVGADLAPWAADLTIDLGKKDGVEPGMVAMSSEGVVGQVFQSSSNYSKILLISDTRSAVGALVQRIRARGILRGTGDWMCRLDYVEKDVDVRVGDIIITSGTDGIFPKGLLLGKVVNVHKGSVSTLFQEIQVKPAADLRRIEEVLVLAAARPIAEKTPLRKKR